MGKWYSYEFHLADSGSRNNFKLSITTVARNNCRELRKNATPIENKFWNIVRNRGLMDKKFYRQYPIFF